jgi:DNA-directed RNA polymerase subunit RPC12/RpoP
MTHDVRNTMDERTANGELLADALRLDGNAAAGILSEVFVADLTTAEATCAHCGATRAVGALFVYAHGMGTVVRCPSCGGVVLRIARTPTHLWFDATGARHIMIVPSAART